MKALIHNANDVKVLREKGILYGLLASDEDVVEIFKSIDTYGYSNRTRGLFRDVKMGIEEHCNSKVRTWTADLMKTNFRSPRTVIALATAAFLICLTFLQTYFTIYPCKKWTLPLDSTLCCFFGLLNVTCQLSTCFFFQFHLMHYVLCSPIWKYKTIFS